MRTSVRKDTAAWNLAGEDILLGIHDGRADRVELAASVVEMASVCDDFVEAKEEGRIDVVGMGWI